MSALLLVALASADPGATVLFPVRAVNVAPEVLEEQELLYRTAWARLATRPIEPWSSMSAAMGDAVADDAALQAACAALACGEWVTVDLVGFGEEVFVTAVLHGPDGAELQRVEVTTTPRALAPVLDRAAQALVRRIPYARTDAPRAADLTLHTPPAGEPAPDEDAAPSPPTRRRSSGFLVGVRRELAFGWGISQGWDLRLVRPKGFFQLRAGMVIYEANSVSLVGSFGWVPSLDLGRVDLYGGGGAGMRIGTDGLSTDGATSAGIGAHLVTGVSGPTSGLGQLRLQASAGTDLVILYGFVGLPVWGAVEVGVGF